MNLIPTQLFSEHEVIPKVIKVGILPFMVTHNQIEILFMRPKAEREALGLPQFQIAKGTRRINISGQWCDMREDDLVYADESFHESLLDTAIREGHEEIGLRAENIVRLFDLGVFYFISASRGTKKPLHLFAAEIKEKHDFARFEESTSETGWLTPEAFVEQGRADHVAILQEAMQKLQPHLERVHD